MLKLIEDIATTVVGCALVFRFWLQLTHVSPPTVVVNRLMQLSEWLVTPIRRVLPNKGAYDWSIVVGAIIVAFVTGIFDAWFAGYLAVRVIIFCTLASLLHWCIYCITAMLIVEVLFSWIAPYSPWASCVRELNAPILKPIRRFVPIIGGIDFSTLIAFIVLQLLSKFIVSFVFGLLL